LTPASHVTAAGGAASGPLAMANCLGRLGARPAGLLQRQGDFSDNALDVER
jgi:hypothetical protein